MPTIVEFPQVVREAINEFGDLFSCEPQRRHFAESLTGLMVAANKTVTAIDDALIDHDGKFIEDVGWFWDRAEDRNKIAHDYLIANYVCTSGKHYPLEFRRFKKREQCGACRAMLAETLRATLGWVIQQVREFGNDHNHVLAKLRLT
jgi:hypothetical protein